MKKMIVVCSSLIVLLFAGSFSYLQISPPLVAIPSAYETGKKVLLIEVGNKNPFGKIKIQDVLVNNYDPPSKVKVQVSNHTKGFIISDHFNSDESRKYTFKDLKSVKLEPNTDPKEQLKKMNDGTITDDDLIYAITIGHQNRIENVLVKYQYLGVSFEKVVKTNEI
ncbi:hypothetical protein [Cytobacillus sp.]|uniref:hypothetical protein n=1 Tax=Cytobacillus sp. TaxID=2675269 RepID=UPI0028BDFDF2|nr:hypothetical protein [Cytobacillus sp.]